MHGVTAQERIVLLDLQLFSFEFLVARGRVAGWRLAFLARFRAFDRNDFARHKFYSLSFAGFSSGSSPSSPSDSVAPVVSTLPSVPRRRDFNAPSRSSWLCA